MKSSPFDDSPKAQVWGTFIQRLQQETSKYMKVYPSSSSSSSSSQERQERSNIKHLVRLFHDFMVATKDVTLEYDEEVPEMLVGATVQVTWFRNTKYNGRIEEYMTAGEHKGAHKCVYTDGDVKYYHIKVVPNEKGTSYSIKGKWEVVGGSGRWWEVVRGGGISVLVCRHRTRLTFWFLLWFLLCFLCVSSFQQRPCYGSTHLSYYTMEFLG